MVRQEQPKKKNVEVQIQRKRLEQYYYSPPYGTRYWILSPFIKDTDSELKNQINNDYGDIENIRPMDNDGGF